MKRMCQSCFLCGTALPWGNDRRADGEALADRCSGVARGIQSIGAATHLRQGIESPWDILGNLVFLEYFFRDETIDLIEID